MQKYNRNSHDDGHQARPQRAREIRNIPQKPDEDEGQGDGFGGGVFVVLDQLGHEEEDPAG